MPELLIYYRVRMNLTATAHDLARAFQARLRTRHPGLQTRLLVRADEDPAADPTWMEHYTADPARLPEGIAPALRAEIETEAESLLPCIVGGRRHTEAFVECAS